jgi:hypothetical protein
MTTLLERFPKLEYLPELRKRYYIAFIESVQSAITNHPELFVPDRPIDFEKYVDAITYDDEYRNGAEETVTVTFSKLGLDLLNPDFDSALLNDMPHMLNFLFTAPIFYASNHIALVEKIVPDMKSRLKSDGGSDFRQLWEDFEEERIELTRRLAANRLWQEERLRLMLAPQRQTIQQQQRREQQQREQQREQWRRQREQWRQQREHQHQEHQEQRQQQEHQEHQEQQQRQRQERARENQFIEGQEEEMKVRRPFVEFQELDAYYKSVLGDDYLEQEIFDTIGQKGVIIGEYLDEDSDNLIFQVKGKSSEKMVFASSRSLVQRMLPLYECTEAGSMSSFTGNVYISLTNIGCPCVGVANYDALKMLIRSNCQIFQLRAVTEVKEGLITEVYTGPLASHRVRYLDGMYVSDSHCQRGSEMAYYATFIPSHSV